MEQVVIMALTAVVIVEAITIAAVCGIAAYERSSFYDRLMAGSLSEYRSDSEKGVRPTPKYRKNLNKWRDTNNGNQ